MFATSLPTTINAVLWIAVLVLGGYSSWWFKRWVERQEKNMEVMEQKRQDDHALLEETRAELEAKIKKLEAEKTAIKHYLRGLLDGLNIKVPEFLKGKSNEE